ncbi:hypothetical protein ASE12_15370 [Aeromicrobium sp. Root236]|uniref:hypothetical protein n=1 Tax=Aeromicrobium sp. Root236 TaxID=1736498 RepID=UPI0006FC686E|nr:hypothetical protein [Aeromicrobium sp. Root236]KRC66012.1 hypothetical protein ASE12_15370 [Aeromicrobium sp. Root236]
MAVLHELDRTDAVVRGRHHSEWVATLDRLRARGRDDTGLALLLECMAAAEREAWATQGVPPQEYAHRAAVIHRRRRDYAAEVEVLERWIAACPEPRDPYSRLAVRLVKARRLRDAASQARRRA